MDNWNLKWYFFLRRKQLLTTCRLCDKIHTITVCLTDYDLALWRFYCTVISSNISIHMPQKQLKTIKTEKWSLYLNKAVNWLLDSHSCQCFLLKQHSFMLTVASSHFLYLLSAFFLHSCWTGSSTWPTMLRAAKVLLWLNVGEWKEKGIQRTHKLALLKCHIIHLIIKSLYVTTLDQVLLTTIFRK